MCGPSSCRADFFPLLSKKTFATIPHFFATFLSSAKCWSAFKPDLIHITGPSELGMFGAGSAHHLKLPLAASWHTNVHEYLARRSNWFLRLLPQRQSEATEQNNSGPDPERGFHPLFPRAVMFAPNPELCQLLERKIGRPCHLMPRGVDAELFHPA